MGGEGELQAETTEDDKKKISALDWLMFDRGQRAEALRQANALSRSFIASRKLDAARAVLMKIPLDTVDTMINVWQIQSGTTELPHWQDIAVREYLCIKAYLQAHDAFSDWFEHFHHGKPVAPQMASRATFTERVAHEHKEQQYRSDMERWDNTLELQTKTTVDRLYNVLLFPDGGWLSDPAPLPRLDSDDMVPGEEPGRHRQMEVLRQLCIPQITLLLHTVLHNTSRHRDCFLLADVIASEQHQLYKVFSKEQLRQFLTRIQESSLLLLDKSCDALGFNSK
jgi:nuclear pore complex protein Nup107